MEKKLMAEEPKATIKGQYGIKGIRAFPIISRDENDVPTYGEAIRWAGARALTLNPTAEATSAYADDMLWITLAGTQGSEGEITCYTFPADIKTGVMGYEADVNKFLAKTGQSKPSALMYETTEILSDGTESPVLNVLYNVTLGDISESEATKEASVELKEFVVPYTAGTVSNPDGKTFSKVEIQKSVVGEEIYNKAKEKPILFGEEIAKDTP